MSTSEKNKIATNTLLERLLSPRQKLPESFLKAAGIIRNKKQRQSLERHVKKMRAEWR